MLFGKKDCDIHNQQQQSTINTYSPKMANTFNALSINKHYHYIKESKDRTKI